MLLAQAEVELILNRRIKRRKLTLPVERGRLGELKRCPLREGGVYNLTGRLPLDRFGQESLTEPTRGRQVLAWIDRCETPVKRVLVTITHVRRERERWEVSFVRGDLRDAQDTPIFLAGDGGYTTVASRQAVPGDPEVMMRFADDLEKARAKAREARVAPQRALVGRMCRDADTLHAALTDMKLRNRARRIAHDLAKLALELPSADLIDCEADVARDEPHADADSPHSRRSLALPVAVA